MIEEIDGHRLHAPTLVVFELMTVAWKRSKKQPAATVGLARALGMPLVTLDKKLGAHAKQS